MRKYKTIQRYPERTEELRREVKLFGDFHRLKEISGLSLQTIANFAKGKTYFLRAETVWSLQEALRRAAQKPLEQVPVKQRAEGWRQRGDTLRPRQARGKRPIRRSVVRSSKS